MSKVILTSPCFPKKSYHCGNAVSQIISDIVFKYSKSKSNDDFYYVRDAWNLHGLSSEEMFRNRHGVIGNYNQINDFSNKQLNWAKKEKEYFIDSPCIDSFQIDFNDTNEYFIKFCEKYFKKLVKDGYLEEKNNIFYLNLNKFFENFSVDDFKRKLNIINIVPSYHLNTIISNIEKLNLLHPLTKDRVFSPKINIKNKVYSLNPIFQSFIYPIYISEKYNCEFPCYLQVSGSGHSMLKWYYLTNIVSIILKNNVAYKNLFLHGNILGTDNQPMSKHKNNTIQPSDLYNIINDKMFVRYVLIKTISNKDVIVQIDLAKNEFNKIYSKLKIIKTAKFELINSKDIQNFINMSFDYLSNFKITLAFENFYLAIKKANIKQCNDCINKDSEDRLLKLFEIFLKI